MCFIPSIVFIFVHRHLANFQMRERTEVFWDIRIEMYGEGQIYLGVFILGR